MNIFKFVQGVILSCLVAVVSQNVNATQLNTIKKNGVLKVAVPQDFPPFGSVGLDLKPQGYDIDTAKYLAHEMGVKLKLVPVTSANRIPYLQTRKVDLIISSLGKNAEREKAIDFSTAYAPFFLGVFGQQSEDVTSIAELTGKTVGVTRGSVEDIELSQLVSNKTTLKRFEDNNATLSAYLSGQVSLIATGNLIVADIATRYPSKAPVVKFTLKNSPCFIGVMKGDDALRNRVNKLIKQAKQNGQLNKISLKWLKASFPNDLAD